MPEWLQPVLMFCGAVLGSSVLTAFVTLYFTRPKTTAEAGKLTAEAHKTDAEAGKISTESAQLYAQEIREGLGRWKQAVDDWAECVKAKTDAEGRASAAEQRWREELTERQRVEAYAEGLRVQKVAADVEITRLNGELAEARKGL